MSAVPLLVADVGGTNSRLGLLGPEGLEQGSLRRFRNRDHATFFDLTKSYLGAMGVKRCADVCLAVAAPVAGQAVTLTNLDWRIDKSGVQAVTGADRVVFLNDFEALGFSLDRLSGPQLTHVAGPVAPQDPNGVKLVLGAGTGFNAAALSRCGPAAIPSVQAAECGHITMPVETKQELSLRNFLARGRGRASVERVLSGKGVVETYQWVCEEAGRIADGLTSYEIVGRAIDRTDSLCIRAIDMLVTILARVAGDLVLSFLPHGGLYLSGGVTRALAPLLVSDKFFDVFAAKGRQTRLVQSIPVYLVNDDSAALEGCAEVLTKNRAVPFQQGQ